LNTQQKASTTDVTDHPRVAGDVIDAGSDPFTQRRGMFDQVPVDDLVEDG
jgi:hypothetical protein